MISDTSTATKSRNGKIDFLRFVFALVIVLHHTRYLLGDEHCLFLGGSLGVEFFFIVSGYLMMASAEKKRNAGTTALGTETVQFLKRKLRAILPEFLTAWIIGFVFVCIADHLTLRGIVRLFVNGFWELTLLKMSGLSVKSFNGAIWYVSAMFIVMAVLYPLLRRFPDVFPKIAAPMLTLMIMGYFCRTDGSPRDPTEWMGIVYKGLLRAAAEISLGVVVYQFADRAARISWTKAARILLTLLEAGIYIGSIVYMYLFAPSKDDYFIIAMLAIAIGLSFARTGYGASLFDNRISSFLAKFSTALYFSHLYYAQHLMNLLPGDLSPAALVGIYLLSAFVTTAAVLLIAGLFRKNREKAVSLFVSGQSIRS